MTIKVINKSNNELPKYQTLGAAGMDISAFIPETIILYPGERKLIPTGLYMQIQEGYEVQIRPRSGLALKHGITVLNAPGTIDCDYTGEVGVILLNTSKVKFEIKSGDRIAQMVASRYDKTIWHEVDVLDSTKREGGFGSTGK